MDRSEKTIIMAVIVVVLGCLCLAVFCGGFFFISREFFQTGAPVQTQAPTVETEPAGTAIPLVNGNPDQLKAASNTIAALETEQIPSSNLVILAERFGGKKNIPLQLMTAPVEYKVGDKINFYKLNVDTNETTSVTAELKYIAGSVYFWVEDGVSVDKRDLKILVEKFANQIYPTDQEFFGKEWIPGVDNDPHLYVLYASDLGSSLAGYNSASDAVLPVAHEYSNAHEMFYINSDIQTLTDPYTLSVMAHELQHLIHDYHDPNEELWLNEGFSELATLLNGYDAGGFDYLFSYNTDLQLNDWSGDSEINDYHYGASFLFVTYMLDRFGEDFTKAIVADPMNGFASIDNVLAARNVTDPSTGKVMTTDVFFTDWTIANYYQDTSLLDGRYGYSNYPTAPDASTTETIYTCDGETQDRTVKQYGTDYIEIDCSGNDLRLTFAGDPVVKILPIGDTDNTFMWSNRADSSDTTLTHEFDLTTISGTATLTYDTWYDLETDYDYVYLLASENGTDWKILNTPSCTNLDLTGSSYGCGYNGESGGWITEEVDLSSFTGNRVWLKFEYITDEAVTGEGFALDNLSLLEIGYSEDFEANNGSWITEGFVHIKNVVPQTFLVSLITKNGNISPHKYEIAAGDTLTLDLQSLPGENYVLVVSGSVRYTRQEASYHIQIK